MIVASYIRTHLATGNSGRLEKVFEDQKHLDRVLADWNYQQPNHWKYARDPDTPVRRASKAECEDVYPQLCY